ncbi:xanthine dehydrogenase [Alkalihalobacillus alcalophilus ATCC 27647 = CGMCC 1.3604]|uniref:Xanthine dehydrogenase n=1 Tax=Alkalihalobacillus alcalophilus ATCC 27647 = CGMCC 1.3604 TaxID=1218173 RepID=A0A094WRP4_ALKAL|nr:xanthine dehydrogenase [Alkalihalobacillus alcalophilus ATCC 27647 = CGMCC 1.3604]THG89780.1 xanthine dehydrogenase [Alkalihalobacillus alcalophilus ATCC 27647 = CGMCC 1.3604]
MDKNDVIAPYIALELEIDQMPYRLEVEATRRLIDILREDLQLVSTKISCEIGRCGACSVLVNGRLVNACLTLAYHLEGAKVETIVSLSKERLDPIQQAFMEEGGFQCGYCTPGMVMATKALLNEKPNPTKEEIKQGLSGNLCRCTGYAGIIRAVEKAAQMKSK